MSIYGGFALRDQESRYNITVFDLILTLSARVTGTLKNRTSEQLAEHSAEAKFLSHIKKLHSRMQLMENHKNLKPFYSQAADRLSERIGQLLGEPHRDSMGSKLGKGLVQRDTESSHSRKNDLGGTLSSGFHETREHSEKRPTYGVDDKPTQ